MLRYFYTDPLAAAWMAKHFGMRFCDYGRFSPPDYVLPAHRMLHPQYAGIAGEHEAVCLSCNQRTYIHPESLALLEPKEDDVGIDTEDLPVSFSCGFWQRSGYDVQAALPVRIIERNGMPFMWPESEEA